MLGIARDEIQLLILSVTGVVVALVVVLIKGTRPVTVPECAKCGYCVKGLPTQICPECGSDLRQVGILEPGMRRPSGTRRLAILLWTVLLPVPAWMVSGSLYPTLVPWTHEKSAKRAIFVQTDRSRITISATMEGRIQRWGSSPAGVPIQHMDLWLEDPVGPMLSIDPGKQTFAYEANGSRVEGNGDPNEATIAGWLSAAGVATRSDLMTERIRDLLKAISRISVDFSASGGAPASFPAVSSFVTVGPASGGASSHPAWSSNVVWPAMFFFWALVWWLGVRLVLRWTRPHESGPPPVGL